jgi:hypothetical protein
MLASLVAALAVLADPTPGLVELHGNQVLPDEVYLAMLGPVSGPATDALAAQLAEATEGFLHRAGYPLAEVAGRVVDGRVALFVDEGALEKVVFRGRLTFQMLRFKLALDLPKDVFNRPALERQLASLSAQLGIEPPDVELVPTTEVKHLGPQVESLGPLGTFMGTALLHPRHAYELHLRFKEREWGTGPGLDLRVSYFDGVELGANAQGQGLLAQGDLWRVALMGGAGLRQDLLTRSFYVFPSRVYAEGQWYTPPAGAVRGFLWLRGEGLARQRADLGLENYVTTNSDLSLNVQVRPFQPTRLFAGVGLQHFYLFGERGVAWGPPPTLQQQRRWRAFAQLGLEAVFDTGDGRWDRRHALTFDARLWANLEQLSQLTYSELRLGWQRVVPLGWHDLVFKARGTLLSGDVLYPFEEPLGEHMRGIFGDLFVREVASGSAAFRFSLTRDLFKLGVFADVAAYGELDRARLTDTPRIGVAFGPTFHVLIEGMFQIDLGGSFGLLSSGRFATGLWAALTKVY